jgi:hypothetical protein
MTALPAALDHLQWAAARGDTPTDILRSLRVCRGDGEVPTWGDALDALIACAPPNAERKIHLSIVNDPAPVWIDPLDPDSWPQWGNVATRGTLE